MSSVTQRIKEIKQPRGGYVKVADFEIKCLNDNNEINEIENVHSSIIGMSVDYLTRYMLGTEKSEAFKISIMGAKLAENLGKKNAIAEANEYLNSINGLDDESIINTCKIVTFDVWFRNPMAALMAKTAKETMPDNTTIQNIKILVNRSLKFFEEYGPITKDGFTFENDGYTETVNSGDGDFLTKDTMWDFKVSKNEPKSDHTLQLLMYYIMGQHSKKEEFKTIKKIGIFNPRLNKVYLLEINKISKDVINQIENDVICY